MIDRNKIKRSIATVRFVVVVLCRDGGSATITEGGTRCTADVPRTMDVRTSYGDSIEVTQLAARRKKPRRKGYSQGSVTTAAIVGAVVGAFIAKNT